MISTLSINYVDFQYLFWRMGFFLFNRNLVQKFDAFCSKKSGMQWNAGTVRKLAEIAETVAIPQLERILEQTASSFLCFTFFCGKRK